LILSFRRDSGSARRLNDEQSFLADWRADGATAALRRENSPPDCFRPSSLLKSHGKPRVDDRHVLSGIIFINRNGLRWRDAPKEYGPAKTPYNRWKRWGDKGVFARMMEGPTSEAATPKTVMIDATYLKAHRTATSLRSKKGDQMTSGAV
jgi:transposase